MKAGKLSLAPIRSGSATTRILSKSDARHWLSDADTQWRLFPNRHVICDVGIVVYRLVQENYDRILKRHLVVATQNKSLNVSEICDSLSFGCSFEVHNGFQYRFYIYSDRASDVTDLQRHFAIHLANACRLQTKAPLVFRVFFDSRFVREDILRCAATFRGYQGLRKNFSMTVTRVRYKNSKL